MHFNYGCHLCNVELNFLGQWNQVNFWIDNAEPIVCVNEIQFSRLSLTLSYCSKHLTRELPLKLLIEPQYAVPQWYLLFISIRLFYMWELGDGKPAMDGFGKPKYQKTNDVYLFDICLVYHWFTVGESKSPWTSKVNLQATGLYISLCFSLWHFWVGLLCVIFGCMDQNYPFLLDILFTMIGVGFSISETDNIL